MATESVTLGVPGLDALLPACGLPFQDPKRAAQAAENVRHTAVHGIAAIGALLVHSAHRLNELDPDTLESAGWLLKELAEMADSMHRIEGDARLQLNGGRL